MRPLLGRSFGKAEQYLFLFEGFHSIHIFLSKVFSRQLAVVSKISDDIIMIGSDMDSGNLTSDGPGISTYSQFCEVMMAFIFQA